MKPEEMTAWALDELSEEERAQIEALLKDDAEMQSQAGKTKSFCDFLTTELRDDSLALTSEQRERLQAVGTETKPAAPVSGQGTRPKQPSFWRRHAVANLAAAAAVVMGTTVLIRKQMEPESAQAEASVLTGYIASGYADDNRASLPASNNAPVIAQASPKKEDASRSNLKPNEVFANALRSDPVNSAARRGVEQRPLEPVSPPKPMPAAPVVAEAQKDLGFSLGAAAAPAAAPAQEIPVRMRSNEYWGNTQSMTPAPPPPTLAGRKRSEPRLLDDEAPADLRAAPAASVAMPAAAAAPEAKIAAVAPGGPPPPIGGAFMYMDRDSGAVTRSDESYTPIMENKLQDVRREPLSTFSIDVDTASYANVRRFLNHNSVPPKDAVRVEELINYFPTSEQGPATSAKEPFAVRVEMASCPWQPKHRLARIAIKGRSVQENRQPGNLVFLVDVSGSMNEPDKLPLVQKSLRMLAEQLGENDRVSVVTYAGGTQVVLPPTSGLRKPDILAAIDRLQAGGGTHGSAGIRLAYEQAVAGFIKGGINRVVLCTDGDFNVGISSPEELETYITEKARSGVFLSVLGYGRGNLKDRTMETLADKGNGNYAYIDSFGEARKVLVEQMNGTLVTIAKDVKIQVEFNPAAVRSYRLIGYENRMLAKEDFNDDTKDAGEIGAGHSVTALYELVPASLTPGEEARPVVDALKYQAAPAAPVAEPAAAVSSDEALTVKLRYKKPEAETSQLIEVPVKASEQSFQEAGQEFKFSAAVAGFGLLLRESSYAGELTWDQVRKLAQEGKGEDLQGYRGEFLQLIEKARGLRPDR